MDFATQSPSRFNHAGETYKAYGLTGVFTYPAFRGQGYGRQIVALGTTLLDVACGTGEHLGLLAQIYNVEGLDADATIITHRCRKA